MRRYAGIAAVSFTLLSLAVLSLWLPNVAMIGTGSLFLWAWWYGRS
jgi:hypothetical protein